MIIGQNTKDAFEKLKRDGVLDTFQLPCLNRIESQLIDVVTLYGEIAKIHANIRHNQ